MTRFPLPAAALLAVAALGACGGTPRTTATRAQQAAVADCRRQADAAYVKQNPDLLTDADQLRFSPFSANTTVGITSAGLGQEFGRNQDFRACLNNAARGGGSGAPLGGTETLSPGAPGAGPAGTGPVMSPGGASSLTPGSRP